MHTILVLFPVAVIKYPDTKHLSSLFDSQFQAYSPSLQGSQGSGTLKEPVTSRSREQWISAQMLCWGSAHLSTLYSPGSPG